MPLFNLTDLDARLARNQRLLGLDPGTRTIGLALSDVRRVLASPFGTMRRGKLAEAVDAIRAIAKREDVGGLIVGLPLQMDGTLGPAAQAARDWNRARRAASVDRMAAAVILQAALDSLRVFPGVETGPV